MSNETSCTCRKQWFKQRKGGLYPEVGEVWRRMIMKTYSYLESSLPPKVRNPWFQQAVTTQTETLICLKKNAQFIFHKIVLFPILYTFWKFNGIERLSVQAIKEILFKARSVITTVMNTVHTQIFICKKANALGITMT